jgi:predicted transcriptional regulator
MVYTRTEYDWSTHMDCMSEPIFDVVKRRLAESRGRWPDVAEGSGVPISTIRKIAQGQIGDPSVSKVQAIYDHFRAVDEFAQQRRPQAEAV